MINFDGENTFFQFRTHYFWRSKRGLQCHVMACKHYYASFGSKWSYSMQKNQNGFFQWSGHCVMISIKSIFFQTLFIKKYFFKIFINTFKKILAEYHWGGGCSVNKLWVDTIGQWGSWKSFHFIDTLSYLLQLMPCLTLPIILKLFPWFYQYSQ